MAAASSRLLDDRHGSRDQEPPEIPLAHLRYPAQPRLAPRNRQATRPDGAPHEGILLYPQVGEEPLTAEIRLEAPDFASRPGPSGGTSIRTGG